MIIKNQTAILKLKKMLKNFDKLTTAEQVRLLNELHDREKEIEEFEKDKKRTDTLKKNGFLGGDFVNHHKKGK